MELVEGDSLGQRGQPFGGALDLGDAGQEGEQAAFTFGQSAADRRRHLILDPARAAADMAKLDRMGAARALDHRGAPLGFFGQQRRKAHTVERRRHRDDPQIRAERGLGIERQRQSEITVEAAFVDLVEQHRRDPGELGIGLDHLDENALGDRQQPRLARLAAVEPCRIADRLADRLAGQFGDPLGGGAHRKAAWAEQQYLARAPGPIEQSRRRRRRLARAGRRDEHGIAAGIEHGEQIGKDGVDRQRHPPLLEVLQRHRHACLTDTVA